MGDPDFIVIINGWYSLRFLGSDQISVDRAIPIALESYNHFYSDAIKDGCEPDPDFDWDIKEIKICSITDTYKK